MGVYRLGPGFGRCTRLQCIDLATTKTSDVLTMRQLHNPLAKDRDWQGLTVVVFILRRFMQFANNTCLVLAADAPLGGVTCVQEMTGSERASVGSVDHE